MKIYFKKYKQQYLEDAAHIMLDTWNYHKNFPNLKSKQLLYELVFQSAYLESTYCEMAVDEHEKTLGYLMAKNMNISERKLLQSLKFYSKTLLDIIFGKFGNIISGLKALKQYLDLKKTLLVAEKKFDSEILLFFVSSQARGLGIGKKLMNRYISYCKTNKIKNIILITDANCNYGFYDYYGFTLHKKLNSSFLGNHEEENGFSYILELESLDKDA